MAAMWTVTSRDGDQLVYDDQGRLVSGGDTKLGKAVRALSGSTARDLHGLPVVVDANELRSVVALWASKRLPVRIEPDPRRPAGGSIVV